MRNWWPKLVVGLALIVLFVVLGVQLYRGVIGLLGALVNDGDAVVESVYEEDTWTQPPYLPSEADYDSVSAVREYAEPSPTATANP